MDFQAAMMAPTEVLAMQHLHSITAYLEGLDIQVAFLSGSITGSTRSQLFEGLRSGKINILLGTHAVIEEGVEFKNLGLAIT
jgi:ATP-dependent DNA helicase RecG